jgi:predicted N-acyltransferase
VRVEIALLEGVREVAREDWNGLVADDSPFLEWEWLVSLEDSGAVGPGTGWLARPLVAREDGRVVAACPLYLKGNSEGEFVFDHAWADAAARAGIAYYPKLLVGVPFTPVAGARLLVAPGSRPERLEQVARGLRAVCERAALSGVHVNFCRPDEVAPLQAAGFLPRLGFQYHWENAGYASFEDYLGRLRSKRRNQIRRERRALAEAGIALEAHVGDAIPDEIFRALFGLYASTVDKYPWGRRYLNPRFFELLRERFRHRLCVIVARADGAIVAGALNVQKGPALYGRYWGSLREVRFLHFDVCYYAAVEHCIRHGLARFEPGAGGDYKQLRGFDAEPTWSLHWLADTRLADAVGRYLEREREDCAEAIRWLRERSAFKRADCAPGD